MRRAFFLGCAALTGCLMDSPHRPVYLPSPYRERPASPADLAVEAGTPTRLENRQQVAVVAGVTKWMKDPGSAKFGRMAAAKNRGGSITVCGYVDGRNSRGVYAGLSPFIGVLLEEAAGIQFVVVEIGSSSSTRPTVQSLCHDGGIRGIR